VLDGVAVRDWGIFQKLLRYRRQKLHLAVNLFRFISQFGGAIKGLRCPEFQILDDFVSISDRKVLLVHYNKALVQVVERVCIAGLQYLCLHEDHAYFGHNQVAAKQIQAEPHRVAKGRYQEIVDFILEENQTWDWCHQQGDDLCDQRGPEVEVVEKKLE